MKNADLYSFGPDGTLWTRFNGFDRRPATVEERLGYCLETAARVTPFRAPPEQPAAEPPPVALYA